MLSVSLRHVFVVSGLYFLSKVVPAFLEGEDL